MYNIKGPYYKQNTYNCAIISTIEFTCGGGRQAELKSKIHYIGGS